MAHSACLLGAKCYNQTPGKRHPGLWKRITILWISLCKFKARRKKKHYLVVGKTPVVINLTQPPPSPVFRGENPARQRGFLISHSGWNLAAHSDAETELKKRGKNRVCCKFSYLSKIQLSTYSCSEWPCSQRTYWFRSFLGFLQFPFHIWREWNSTFEAILHSLRSFEPVQIEMRRSF